MQVASNPDVEIVSSDEISEEMKAKEWEFEANKPDLASKPEEIKNKIVEGRVKKSLNAKVLLEQPYIREPNITVNELVKQSIALLGENIKVKRFTRYELGS